MALAIERLERVPPEWAKVHAGTQAALLRSEARALTALRKTVSEIIHRVANDVEPFVGGTPSHVKLRVMVAIRKATAALHGRVEHTVRLGRQEARLSSLRRLRVELDLLRSQLTDYGFGPESHPSDPPLSKSDHDAAFAHQTGMSFASAWSAVALGSTLQWAEDPSKSLPAAIRRTATLTDYRLRRIATTDTARAFNDEHDEGVGYVVGQTKATWLGAVFKRWDATLDRRICNVCKALDGQIVLVGREFRSGEVPGEVHVCCRCLDSLIFIPARLKKTGPGHYTGLEDEEAA